MTTAPILVTGANGFVGAAIAARMRQTNAPVRLATRQAYTDPDAIAVGDIGPDTDWTDALSGVRQIIHCAARVHQMDDRAADPLAAFRAVNRDGTLALARQAAAAGVERLVFISSIKVNGEHTRGRAPFSAGDPADPHDPYAVSKWEAEQGLHGLAAETGMDVVVIRPPLVYGPGVGANFARMAGWVARGWPLPLGLCRNRRSLIAVGNLARIAIDATMNPDAAGQTLLVDDGEPIAVAALLRRMGEAWSRPARLLPVPPPLLRLAGSLTGQRAAIDRLCDPLEIDSAPTWAMLRWTPPASTMAATLRAMAAQR